MSLMSSCLVIAYPLQTIHYIALIYSIVPAGEGRDSKVCQYMYIMESEWLLA